jgi:hypothetical protein
MGVDHELRLDSDRLRRYRLDRARAAPDAGGCGAFLLFCFCGIRYPTSTWIGGALGDKMTRYALLSQGGEPVLRDFGSAARHRNPARHDLALRSYREAGHEPVPGPERTNAQEPPAAIGYGKPSWTVCLCYAPYAEHLPVPHAEHLPVSRTPSTCRCPARCSARCAPPPRDAESFRRTARPAGGRAAGTGRGVPCRRGGGPGAAGPLASLSWPVPRRTGARAAPCRRT